MYFSKLTGGFYDEALHGARRIMVADPAWVRPQVDGQPDMGAVAPMIEIDNPDCEIPADAVEITSAQHAALLDGQSQGQLIVADFDGRPVLQAPPAPTSDEIKAAAWGHIKAERDRRTLQGGYQAGGHWFHSDTFSRTQQLGLVLLGANLPAGVQWKTMSGEMVPMTPALAQQVFSAAAASDIAVFGVAETHKAAMEASADPAGYDFSGGWPLAFGE